MPKRRLLLLVGLTIAAVAVPVVLALLPHPGVTKANFDRVQNGMTKAEVNQFLGVERAFAGDFDGSMAIWDGDDGSKAIIQFHADGSAYIKEWRPSTESITDKFRRWLHLPK